MKYYVIAILVAMFLPQRAFAATDLNSSVAMTMKSYDLDKFGDVRASLAGKIVRLNLLQEQEYHRTRCGQRLRRRYQVLDFCDQQ